MRRNYNMVPIRRYLVEKACKKIIEEIDNERNEIWESEIEDEMNKKFFPCKTREKAIRYIREKRGVSIFHPGPIITPDDYRVREYELAEELLEAIKISNDIMYLNVETAKLISEYINEEHN